VSNPYEFNDLNDDSYNQEIKPELLVDSILVFIHRLYYFFMSAAAYIAFFIFDSLIVGRTLACVASISYILELFSLLILTHLSVRRSKINKTLLNMHRELTANGPRE
jgi:hypothetical protein